MCAFLYDLLERYFKFASLFGISILLVMLLLSISSFISSFFKAKGPSNEIGKWGEDLATKELKRKKYRILGRNWSSQGYELDIICFKEGILVFVEVRTRNSRALVQGRHSLTQRKRKSLRKAAKLYRKSLPEYPQYYRFDLVEISYETQKAYKLRHYEKICL